ncbi:MAG: sigma-70 family RNA polymerase sigma factor [Planctomycetota bacterium]
MISRNATDLLEHDDFARSLARRLLADAARADDVVQDAWLASADGGPRPGWDARAWLSGVVRNRARNVTREEARRSRRERAAARPEPTASTLELVTREADRQQVIDAVLALEEPYRTVVVLRFYEGMTPRAIAAHLGIPASTVRTRLARALERLRAALDRQFGSRRAWCLALAPIAALDRVSRAALLSGVVVMKLKIAAVLLVVAGAVSLAFWSRDEGRARGEREAPAVVAHRDADMPEVGPPDAPLTPRGPAPLLCRVTAAEPIEFGEVTLVLETEDGRELRRAAADVETAWTLPEGVEPKRVRAEHPTLMADVVDVVERAAVLRLEPASFVVGDGTREPDDAPILCALYALRDGVPDRTPVWTGRAEAELRAATREEGPHLFVAVREGSLPWSTTCTLRLRTTFRLPPIGWKPGVAIAGRVTDAADAPLSGMRIEATPLGDRGPRLEFPDRRLAYVDGAVHFHPARTRTDAEGRYRVAGLRAGPYQVHCEEHEGIHPGALSDQGGGDKYERKATAPRADVDFKLALAALDVLVLRSGTAVANARLEITHLEYRLGMLRWRANDYYTTGAEGRARLFVRPEARYIIACKDDRFDPAKKRIEAPAVGQTAEVALAVEKARPRAQVDLVFRTEGEAELPRKVAVSMFLGDEPPHGGVHRTIDIVDGVARLADLHAGAYRLKLRMGAFYGPEIAPFFDVDLELEVRPGQTLRRAVPLKQGGRLRVTVRAPDGRTDIVCYAKLTDANGKDVAVQFSKFEGDRMMSLVGALGPLPGPAHVNETLPPGRYTLRIEPPAGNYEPQEIAVELRAGEVVEKRVDLSD